MAPRWPFALRRPPLPPSLVAAIDPGEDVQLVAPLADGRSLAVSRFGLWVVGEEVARWNWELISKARLTDLTLTVVVAAQVEMTPDGTAVLLDQPVRSFELAGTNRLTDVVHTRVRRSVAASRHLPWPRAGGWVVLRRVPGRDGLTTQIRLDPGADAHAPGFLEAVADVTAELRAPFLLE
ncbi:hypothetical protein SAMN04515671_4401 [Nakamurella panacisegetis]|uniref:Uncharacterized protein n=1 Tax=Nakamurella panacisegetis TaxID=1090615 RepID=A0A1H0T1F3_9ACTN|nr:hypothetical protein [Nakamurella panacisegetis]SDP47635.1 hypothetical protein SAMN04515671_4401 [Nakamurella panacisegetis]